MCGEAPPALLRSPEALFEAAKREAEWCISVRRTRYAKAYITKMGIVVEYVVEHELGPVLTRVILAEEPVRAL